MVSRIKSITALICFLLPSYCAPPNNFAQQIDHNFSEMRPILERFATDRNILSWKYNIPLSENDQTRIERFYHEWQKKSAELNFDTMSLDGQIEFRLFNNLLDYELRKIELQNKRHQEISVYLPFAQIIVKLEEERRKTNKIDGKLAADRLNLLLSQISKTKKNLEDKHDSKIVKKTVVLRAVRIGGNLKNSLRRWFRFYNGYDPLFTWWAEDIYKKTDKELDTYLNILREKIVGIKGNENDGPIIGDPIGREALLVELKNEMISYTPEELIKAGENEYKWCEAEMIKASKQLGYSDDWLKALEHVKTKHVKPGEQPYLIRDLAWEAVDFLEKEKLLTIPSLAKETWKIEMMSPERQKVNPFFTGGRVISVSFPTNTMSQELKQMSMKGNNIHFSRATVHHELIPGHHLQSFMNSRYKTYRNVFATPFWLEGWPLHWEMLLYDLEFPKSPENKIGMLFWRMHRCARIIFSLSFHLNKMTPEECIDMLVKKVGHEPSTAIAEVRRSCGESYPPLYQCAYLIGGLQMRALYNELVGSGEKTNREFHDAVMRENSIPIVMLRAKLTGQKLKKSGKLEWKFLNY